MPDVSKREPQPSVAPQQWVVIDDPADSAELAVQHLLTLVQDARALHEHAHPGGFQHCGWELCTHANEAAIALEESGVRGAIEATGRSFAYVNRDGSK